MIFRFDKSKHIESMKVSMTVDTTQKMKNGQNMEDSINDGIKILRDDVEKLLREVIDQSATCIFLTRRKTTIAGKAIVTYIAIVTVWNSQNLSEKPPKQP